MIVFELQDIITKRNKKVKKNDKNNKIKKKRISTNRLLIMGFIKSSGAYMRDFDVRSILLEQLDDRAMVNH